MNPVEKNYLKELLEYIGLDLRMDDKESEYSIICDAEGIAYATESWFNLPGKF